MSAWLNTPLTDLEPADRSSVRQRRQARQFFAGPRRLKDFSSITVFWLLSFGLYVSAPARLAPPFLRGLRPVESAPALLRISSADSTVLALWVDRPPSATAPQASPAAKKQL